MESICGGRIIHVWGTICGIWELRPPALHVLAPACYQTETNNHKSWQVYIFLSRWWTCMPIFVHICCPFICCAW